MVSVTVAASDSRYRNRVPRLTFFLCLRADALAPLASGAKVLLVIETPSVGAECFTAGTAGRSKAPMSGTAVPSPFPSSARGAPARSSDPVDPAALPRSIAGEAGPSLRSEVISGSAAMSVRSPGPAWRPPSRRTRTSSR